MAHGMAAEKRSRIGSMSVTELRALAFIGRNEETGWTHLLVLSPVQRTEWLGRMIEAKERQIEIDARRSARMNRTLRQIKVDQANKLCSRQRNAKKHATYDRDAA